jgi:hypothetical protein
MLFEEALRGDATYQNAIFRAMGTRGEFYDAGVTRSTTSEILKSVLVATFIDHGGEVTPETVRQTIIGFGLESLSVDYVFTS